MALILVNSFSITDNWIIMSIINDFKRALGLLQRNGFRNAIIIFGFCVCIIAITSYDSISNVGQSKFITSEEFHGVVEGESQNDQMKSLSKKEHKISNPHNFISSYLLQESYQKRERNSKNEESNLFRNLRQLHKTIFIKVVGLF